MLADRGADGGVRGVDAVVFAHGLEDLARDLLADVLDAVGIIGIRDVEVGVEEFVLVRTLRVHDLHVLDGAVVGLAHVDARQGVQEAIAALERALEDGAGKLAAVVGHVVGGQLHGRGVRRAQTHREAAAQIQQHLRRVKAGIADRQIPLHFGLADELIVRIVQQALKILDWVKKGVPIGQVKPLLERPTPGRTNNWQTLQQNMLQRLQDGKVESLRQMIYDAGREYPRPELVANVLRPLRRQVSANVAAAMTLRAILDGIIIAYTSFCLEGDKKAPGDNILLSGWHLNDPCEIWLEALTRTGQGHRIDILPVPPDALAPDIFPERKWLLVTSGKLTAGRKKQVEQWQQQVSLEVIIL